MNSRIEVPTGILVDTFSFSSRWRYRQIANLSTKCPPYSLLRSQEWLIQICFVSTPLPPIFQCEITCLLILFRATNHWNSDDSHFSRCSQCRGDTEERTAMLKDCCYSNRVVSSFCAVFCIRGQLFSLLTWYRLPGDSCTWVDYGMLRGCCW